MTNNEKKNIKIKETFELGFENFKKNNFTQAKIFFDKVLSKNPDHLESIFFLGMLHVQNNNFKKAKNFFIKTIQIDSNYIYAHYNLGIIFYKLKEFKKSINSYKKTIEINPNHIEAYIDLGMVFSELGKFKEAKNCYEKLILINPNHSDVHYNLGNSFNELKDPKKAINCYQKAIKINSNHSLAHNNLGQVYYKLGNLQKAKNYYEKATIIQSNYAEAYNNLGAVFRQLREFNKAKSCYEKAIQINPNHKQANISLGILLLSMCDFKKGFEKYEWRNKLTKKSNHIKNLEWQGEDLTDKTILILSEQGLGDVIQFARYLYILEKKYLAKIVFRTNKKIKHLFSKSNFKVISNEESIPKYDYYKHLVSLPQILYQKTKTFPKQTNYIFENKKIILKWKNRLNKIKGFKVGINWQGRKDYPDDHLRSIPLKYFEKLFANEKINFISLQKGFGTEQIKNFKYKDKLHDFSSEIDNGKYIFEDTIGILRNIDLVITSDTSIVHLSATLGIKTWLLLHFSPDWRWSMQSKDFSWYENLKIYKQKEVNKWDSVFNIVKKDLVEY